MNKARSVSRSSTMAVAFSIVVSLLGSGCDGTVPGTDQPLLSLGQEVAVTRETVVASGGEIRVDQPGTPVDGLAIVVPDGAYAGDTPFEITYRPITANTLPGAAEPITPLIDIDNGGGFADDFIELNFACTIPDGYVGIGYQYDEQTGAFEVLPTLAQSSTSLTVVTRHFSDTGAVMIPLSTLTGLTIDTGFTPGIDDWQFQNRGSQINPKGNCSGMCTSAMWYFVTQRSAGEAALWGQYQSFDLDGSDANTPMLAADDSMAWRLVSAVQHEIKPATDMFDKIADKIDWNNNRWVGSPTDEFYQIAAALYLNQDKTTRKSKPVYVIVASAVAGNHALICYGIDGTTLHIADPNFQGQAATIVFHPGTGAMDGRFDPYSSMPSGEFFERFKTFRAYDRIYYGGYTSIFHTTEIQKYWNDMLSGQAGDSLFKSYDLQIEELNGQGSVVNTVMLDLTADNTVGRDTINVNISATGTETRAILYEHAEVKNANSSAEIKDYTTTPLPLNEGDNLLGFYIQSRETWTEEYVENGQTKERTRTEWRWADFRWVNIIFEPGAPSVSITAPANNTTFLEGNPADFTATATDYMDNALTGGSLVWQSNVDGQIGTGTTLSVTDLTLGDHTITVTATDGNGLQATDGVEINIIFEPDAPSVSITSPTDNAEYEETQTVNLQATATDYQDTPLTGSALQWSSDIDGALGSGASLALSDLSPGEHTIIVTATDELDNTANAEVTITIIEKPDLDYNTFGLAMFNVGGYGTNSAGESIQLDYLAPSFYYSEAGTLNGNTFTASFDSFYDPQHVIGTATFTFDTSFETIISFEFDASIEYDYAGNKVTFQLKGTNVPFYRESVTRDYQLTDQDALDCLSHFYWRYDSASGGWNEFTTPKISTTDQTRLKIYFANE